MKTGILFTEERGTHYLKDKESLKAWVLSDNYSSECYTINVRKLRREFFNVIEDIKKALLVGVGSTAIALEKAVEQVDKLVSRGKLTVAEGRKLTEELIQRKNKDVSLEEKETLEAILLEMNVAQRKDIEDLEAKVEALERKITDKSTEA